MPTKANRSKAKAPAKKAAPKAAVAAVATEEAPKAIRQVNPESPVNIAIPDRHQRGFVEDLGQDGVKIYLTSKRLQEDGSRSAAINLAGVTISGRAILDAKTGKWSFRRNKGLSEKAEAAWKARVAKIRTAAKEMEKAASAQAK